MTTKRDALIAEEEGADAIGVVVCSESKRSVTIRKAREIFDSLAPNTEKICVTNTENESDIDIILSLKPTAIQVPVSLKIPEGSRTKIYRVISRGNECPLNCDAVVIDESKGRGVPFDQEFAKEIIEKSGVPVILAGGLCPENVGQVIENLSPYAVDVSSGVETIHGIKDRKKLTEFVRICREA
ncbi:phosphoribosylanthranilate isomerase [Methanochimaera problematica]|nr:phosphoribosylanthranilate isomerase [Methanoplanus sp. FWC-SCC4]